MKFVGEGHVISSSDLYSKPRALHADTPVLFQQSTYCSRTDISKSGSYWKKQLQYLKYVLHVTLLWLRSFVSPFPWIHNLWFYGNFCSSHISVAFLTYRYRNKGLSILRFRIFSFNHRFALSSSSAFVSSFLFITITTNYLTTGQLFKNIIF